MKTRCCLSAISFGFWEVVAAQKGIPSEAKEEPVDACGLYLAPSSISEAGLGVYTARDIKRGSLVGEDFQDLYIPILDKFKTLPYKGQHRFLSWLGYVWPDAKNAFYPTYDEGSTPTYPHGRFDLSKEGVSTSDALVFTDRKGRRVSAFSPGIASLTNSHRDLVNIHKLYSSERVEGDVGDSAHDRLGPYAPYYGVAFQSSRDIVAGSELFMNYGDSWHNENDPNSGRNDKEFRPLPYSVEDFTTEAETRTNWDKRRDSEEIMRSMAAASARKSKEKQGDSPLKKQDELREKLLRKKTRKATGKATEVSSGGSEQDEREIEASTRWQQQKTHPSSHGWLDTTDDYRHHNVSAPQVEVDDNGDSFVIYRDVTRSIKQTNWLKEKGFCLDSTLRWGRSRIPGAGRGAFAKRKVSQGSTIALAPLLALKREDLQIHKMQKQSNGNISTAFVEQELMLNYCFGHKDSQLLFVPIVPVVNFINHDSQAPNARIRWPLDNDEAGLFRNPADWLSQHPLDVIDQSGKIAFEFVALRDIGANEEVRIDYGRDWKEAWRRWRERDDGDTLGNEFRKEIGVPQDLFPPNWMAAHNPMNYEVAPFEPLKPGELVQPKWLHNGERVAEYLYAVGLPEGFTKSMRQYSDRLGITDLFQTLLLAETPFLSDNEWFVFTANNSSTGFTEEWFAHSFENVAWKFNMHYIAAWDEAARLSFLRAMGQSGLGTALESIGNQFGLKNLTCFHASFMGATECQTSRRHADVYSTDGKGFNIIFPIVLADGSKPELDIITQDPNVEVAIKYKEDIAYVLSDFGYHKTSANSYGRDSPGSIRIVAGTYCAQVDRTNHEMIRSIYNGEIRAPFRDQFNELPITEVHWAKNGENGFPN